MSRQPSFFNDVLKKKGSLPTTRSRVKYKIPNLNIYGKFRSGLILKYSREDDTAIVPLAFLSVSLAATITVF